jgi:hypothetical protein
MTNKTFTLARWASFHDGQRVWCGVLTSYEKMPFALSVMQTGYGMNGPILFSRGDAEQAAREAAAPRVERAVPIDAVTWKVGAYSSYDGSAVAVYEGNDWRQALKNYRAVYCFEAQGTHYAKALIAAVVPQQFTPDGFPHASFDGDIYDKCWAKGSDPKADCHRFVVGGERMRELDGVGLFLAYPAWRAVL